MNNSNNNKSTGFKNWAERAKKLEEGLKILSKEYEEVERQQVHSKPEYYLRLQNNKLFHTFLEEFQLDFLNLEALQHKIKNTSEIPSKSVHEVPSVKQQHQQQPKVTPKPQHFPQLGGKNLLEDSFRVKDTQYSELGQAWCGVNDLVQTELGKKQVERHLLEAVRIEEQCKVYTNTKASKSLAEVKDKIHNNGIEIAQLKFAAYLLKELQPHLNGNLDNYYDKWLKSLPKDGQGEAILQ